MATTDASPADFRQACDELLALWNAGPNSATTDKSDEARARVLVGLAIHVVSATKSALILTAQGHNRDAYPLARKCLEFSIFAQWIRLNGTLALQGFHQHSVKRSKQLLASMLLLDVGIPPEVADDLWEADTSKLAEADIAGNLSRICDSLEQGAFLYFLYRGLSSECHPSISAISMMLPGYEAEAAEMGRTSRVPDYVCALSLLLALGAVDDLALSKRLKPDLDRIAAPLGLLTLLSSTKPLDPAT